METGRAAKKITYALFGKREINRELFLFLAFPGVYMANSSSSDLLSIEELSDIVSLSISTIRRRIRDGGIPAIQPGGKGTKLLIPKEWINQQATTPQSSRLEPSSSGRHQRKSISGPPPRWQK